MNTLTLKHAKRLLLRKNSTVTVEFVDALFADLATKKGRVRNHYKCRFPKEGARAFIAAKCFPYLDAEFFESEELWKSDADGWFRMGAITVHFKRVLPWQTVSWSAVTQSVDRSSSSNS